MYNFKLFPDPTTIQGGKASIAAISYRMAHPSFRVQLVQTGPENNFMISYPGWGTINVITIIEYADPEEAPTIAIFDMAKVLTPE